MRTGSPILCGAGAVARLSTPSSAADVKVLPVAGVNSERDVEAAIAITHLGDGCRRRSPAAQHVRTAVMPERFSRVQPAVVAHGAYKRKYVDDADNNNNSNTTISRDPLKRAIENERSYFDNVKRGRFQTDAEPCVTAAALSSKCDEKLGRFVRTCQPHRHTDALLPHLSAAAAGFVGPRSYRTVEDGSRWPASQFDGRAVEKLLLERDVPNKIYPSGLSVGNIPRPAELPVFRKTLYNSPMQLPHHRRRPNEQPYRRPQQEDPNRKFDVMSAFYRLGQQDASAIPSPMRQHRVMVDRREQPIVGFIPQPAPSQGMSSLTRPCYRRRSLDMETENKVKSGEFGTLKSLQVFYEKLRNRREQPAVDVKDVDDRPVMRGRLGSITNWSQYEMLRATKMQSKSLAADQEMAMDLSTHGERTRSTEAVDVQVLRLQPERLMPSLRRKSRSCCNTPFTDPAFLSRSTTSTSPCPMPTLDRINDGISETQSEGAEEFSKAESRLPLKKRRLLEVKIEEDDFSPVASPLVPVKTEVLSDSDISDRDDECHTRRQSNLAKDLTLHLASAEGDESSIDQIVQVMTRLGAPLDCYNNLQQTPLHVAVMSNKPIIVRRLLEAGSSPNVVDLNNMTSVHLAADLSTADCLESIIKHSTVRLNLNAVNSNGLTALHLAVQRENLSAVSLLIDAGARVDVTDGTNGRSPLYFAVDQNNIDIVRLLLAHSSAISGTPTSTARSSPAAGSRTTSPSYSPLTSWCRTADVSSRVPDVCVTADVRV